MTLSDLDQVRVEQQLKTSRFGRSLTVLNETGSTNDDARKAASEGAPDGHVIVADAQTKGRGSHGRVWSSPAGVDLYFSLIAKLDIPLSSLPPLALAVGLAVADTADHLHQGARAQVKWPNDVWIEGRKLAGTLVESASTGSKAEPVVIGIGLNVNRREFPPGLDTEPTSLALTASHTFDRSTVLAMVLGQLETWVDRFATHGAEPIVTAVNRRLALRHTLARCEDVIGTVEEVSHSGALLMRTDHGVREVFAGTLRPV